jgi:hypothetical protein
MARFIKPQGRAGQKPKVPEVARLGIGLVFKVKPLAFNRKQKWKRPHVQPLKKKVRAGSKNVRVCELSAIPGRRFRREKSVWALRS